ncbi:MAG: MltA domain-containing protein [Hyphomonadaceae bacterium]|nr:MltA domain-containing protein [Hyphomonadaceae bacterium]
MRNKAASFVPLAAGLALAACATGERPAARPAVGPQPVEFSLRPVNFSDLPGWANADLAPALTAFKRQCASWSARAADAPLGAGARYGGTVGSWAAACAQAASVPPGAERAFFESAFIASAVEGPGDARLTGYYEPIVQASRWPVPGFTEPMLRKPSDMVTVDLGAFAEAYDNAELRGAPRTLTGKLYGDRVRPYPTRAEINAAPPSQAFGYIKPADLYNLQVQGSGRVRFNDGVEARAAYAAQNGYRWRSAIGAARDNGRLTDATWRGFRAYLDALTPDGARAALNEDPSYVFFQEEPIADPSAGPRGAANVNLTALGSLAVDPAFHPYGALLFVDAVYDGYAFQRLLVAQDTGGAIRRGPRRGDVFFGSGPEAGLAAERMNSQGVRFWTLMPRGAPIAALEDDADAG